MNSSNRHLRYGWWSLLVFLVLGLGLETLHGFKVGWYLDVSHDMRRLMFTLAHAHGALLGLVNIAAGLTLRAVKEMSLSRGASSALIWGSILMPAGFFLGGIIVHDGDPSLGVVLVPVGAFLLLYGVARAAQAVAKGTSQPAK